MGRGDNTEQALAPESNLRTESFPGRLLSIEGLDGAGKTTATEALLKRLGSDVVCMREPGGTLIGEQLRNILKTPPNEPLPQHATHYPMADSTQRILRQLLERSGNADLCQLLSDYIEYGRSDVQTISEDLSPEDELYLFNAARAQMMDEKILPALRQGKTVLLDRFIDSTVAYQGYGRGLDPEYVQELCLQATGGLKPSQTFYLQISPQTRQARMAGRGEAEDRIEATGSEFFAKIAAGFQQLAASDQRFTVIDAEGTPEQVYQQCLQAMGDAEPGS